MKRTQYSRIPRGPARARKSGNPPPRKYETEKAKRFLGDGLEWAEVHNRVDILGIEVRPCGNGIKASDDEFSGDTGERLYLVLSISRSGSHLVTQHAIALFLSINLSS